MCMVIVYIIVWNALIASELNIFLNRLQHLLVMKLLKQIFIEYLKSLKAYDSIMYGYFCIEFAGFMLKGKSLTEMLPNINKG